MTVQKSQNIEKKGLERIADLMAVSARTAPKTGGIDEIVTAIVNGKEKDKIVKEMTKIANQKKDQAYWKEVFERDSSNLENSPLVLLVGVKGRTPKRPTVSTDCGACGFRTCNEFSRVEEAKGEDFPGPNCIWHGVDLGVALASAAKTASDHNVDNRVMYTVGVAAKSLEILDSTIVVGIPISATGKDIYFDRD